MGEIKGGIPNPIEPGTGGGNEAEKAEAKRDGVASREQENDKILTFQHAIEAGCFGEKTEKARELYELFKEIQKKIGVGKAHEAAVGFEEQLREQGISPTGIALHHLIAFSSAPKSKWREGPFDIGGDGETEGRFEKFIRELAREKETETARSPENNPQENSS